MNKYLPALLIGLGVAVAVGLVAATVNMGFMGWVYAIGLGVFAGYITANLAGTKAGPKASEAQRAAALSLAPSAGKALLIVYRQGFVGMAAGLNVSLDGKPLVQLKSPQFTAVEVDPGQHGLGFAFGGLAGAQNKPIIAGADLRAGEIAAFRLDMRMGALKNSIDVTRVENSEDLRATLGGMKMVAPAV